MSACLVGIGAAAGLGLVLSSCGSNGGGGCDPGPNLASQVVVLSPRLVAVSGRVGCRVEGRVRNTSQIDMETVAVTFETIDSSGTVFFAGAALPVEAGATVPF
jgi:hypothetical protein